MKKFLLIGLAILASACNMKQAAPTIAPSPVPATASATLTPAPTFTPEPTLTATPAFTSTPMPLYFTEEFKAGLGVWTTFQTGGALSAVPALANDALNVQMNSPHTWFYAISNAHEYPAITVVAKASGAPSGSLGLVCQYSAENGWYEFNITHEGSFSVLSGKWLADGIAQYRPILNSSSEYLQVGNMNYEIGLTCNNNILFLQVNGKMFRKVDVSHIGLPPGKVGISAASFDNVPMSAVFDWFRVGPPEW